jgi:hypothetical protein
MQAEFFTFEELERQHPLTFVLTLPANSPKFYQDS